MTEVSRALGISRPTVYKWWDAKPALEEPVKEDAAASRPFVAYRFTPDGVEPVFCEQEKKENN